MTVPLNIYRKGKSGKNYRLKLFKIKSELPPLMGICLFMRIENGKKPQGQHWEATLNLYTLYQNHPFREEMINDGLNYIAVYLPKQDIEVLKFIERDLMHTLFYKFQNYPEEVIARIDIDSLPGLGVFNK
jgi:hypothetical protein